MPFPLFCRFGRENCTNGAAGFIVSNYNSSILLAGCCSIDNATLADIEAKALLLALHAVHSYHSRLHHIFITNRDLHDAIKLDASRSTWQTDLWIKSIIDILSVLGNPEIYAIPHSWNAATHRLAIHGLSQHSLSLFHQGRELPHWLMKIFLSNGFTL